MSNFYVSHMSLDEVAVAIDWAKKEGWNPGLHDTTCFYQTDPQGFFAGKLDEQIIAVGSAVVYDPHFAFCGFYIVDKNYREQGYGLQLTKARLNYIGERNAGIDGVLDMVDNYTRIGYRFAHSNARYVLANKQLNPPYAPAVIDANSVSFSELSQYDRQHFPAPRQQFLRNWLKQDGALALAYVEKNQLRGYGVIRKCFTGYKIGPLFADNIEVAVTLFEHLVEYAQGDIVYLDIPENNAGAIKLVRRYDMVKVFATARMYLKGEPRLAYEEIYGITSFELG